MRVALGLRRVGHGAAGFAHGGAARRRHSGVAVDGGVCHRDRGVPAGLSPYFLFPSIVAAVLLLATRDCAAAGTRQSGRRRC